jgi:hypothetical protein
MPRILSQHGDLPRTKMPSVQQQMEKRPSKLLGEGQSTLGSADIVEDHDPPRLARLLRFVLGKRKSMKSVKTCITGTVVSCCRRQQIHRVTTRSVRSPNIQASNAIRRRPREAPMDVTRTACLSYWLSSSSHLVCSTGPGKTARAKPRCHLSIVWRRRSRPPLRSLNTVPTTLHRRRCY